MDNISFDILKGEIFGMIGPNGAGKSTTFAMLTTLIKPTEGTIRIASYEVQKDANKIRQLIGIVPQQHSLYPDRLHGKTLNSWATCTTSLKSS